MNYSPETLTTTEQMFLNSYPGVDWEEIFTHRKAKKRSRHIKKLSALFRKKLTPQVIRAMKREFELMK